MGNTLIIIVALALSASLFAQPWVQNLPNGKSKSDLTKQEKYIGIPEN